MLSPLHSLLNAFSPYSMLDEMCATDLGAAYGTAKSGVGISSMGIMHPERVMRNIIPVVMAGILGIYGLIVGAILVGKGTSIVAISLVLVCWNDDTWTCACLLFLLLWCSH